MILDSLLTAKCIKCKGVVDQCYRAGKVLLTLNWCTNCRIISVKKPLGPSSAKRTFTEIFCDPCGSAKHILSLRHHHGELQYDADHHHCYTDLWWKNPLTKVATSYILEKNTDTQLSKEQKESIQTLDFRDFELRQIPPRMREFTNLKDLSLEYNKITDLKGIEHLHNLEILSLDENPINNIEALGELTKMKKLSLEKHYRDDLALATLKGLENLTQLEFLSLYQSNPFNADKLVTFEEIENLTNLRFLNLGGYSKGVKDLSKLNQLESLVINSVRLQRIKGLENLKQLRIFDLRLYDPEGDPFEEGYLLKELKEKLPKCKFLEYGESLESF